MAVQLQTAEIVEAIQSRRKELSEYFLVHSLALFGSVARGEATDGMDFK